MMAEFHFLRPLWLIALLPCFLLIGRMLLGRFAHSRWEQVCDPALLPYILNREPGKQSRLPALLLSLCTVLVVVALAGPVWERLPQPAFRNESALVLVFDLSHSMDATDLQPTRLVRARYKVADILARRVDGQTALVVFAGDAFAVTPLTDDTETINAQLGAMSTSLMPVQGSRPESGLLLARDLLKQAGLASGDILLITDGGSEATADVVQDIADSGYRISVYAIGTAEGAPVAMGNGRFLQDASGAIVVPSLDIPALKTLADLGHGAYQSIRVDDADIDYLLAGIQQDTDSESASETDNFLDRWQEQGPWLLLLVLPIAALAFRRGLLLVVLVILLPLPRPAQAFDWQGLWQTPDQQAQQALQAGNASQAAQLFKDREWKAAAEYRAGNYETAAKLLEDAPTTGSLYNRGNALARSGDYQAALDSYKQLLEIEPDNEDALHNKQIVEEQLKQQQKQEQQQEKEKEKEQKQDQQQQEQDQKQEEQQQGKGEQYDQASQGSQQSADQDGEKQQGKPDGEDLKQTEHQQQENAAQSDDKAQQTDTEEQQEAQQQAEQDEEPQDARQLSDEEVDAEQKQQMTEQWLRKIPDDPGALLRRKFKYQYGQRERAQAKPDQPW